MSLPIPTTNQDVSLLALRSLIRDRSVLGALEVFQQQLGSIFQITLPGFKPVMLAGPEAARFVLVSSRDDLRWRSEGDPVTALLRHGVLVTDGEQHDTLRRAMTPSLHKNMMNRYVETMWRATDQVMQTWVDGEQRDMLVEMRRIALLILTETLFKVDFAPELNRLWQPILKAIQYISPGWWVIWPGVPRPGYGRVLRQLDDYLFQIIRARRAAVGEADDLLGGLIMTPGMDDDLIRDQLLTMLIAGHDTSTALLSWSLYLLGKHPEAMQRAVEEARALPFPEPPSLEQITGLHYLDQVIHEALRMYPPIHLGARIAAQDLDFQGYIIPAGTRVMYSIYLTHRMKAHWNEPARFNPERFTPENNRQRAPYTYLPFGGGPRNCIGALFGQVESKIVLARILQQYSLMLAQQPVHAHMGATLEPRPGVMMNVRRH
ncbi:MAG: cytochrome P450 [Chloroflexi bacterium]|nr:cytochrome P450 [Chloroflexota bacterium]